MDRVRTGVPGLDDVLRGGFARGEATLVKGGPGSGKTVLGVQWVYRGAMDLGEPGVIIALEESPQQFYRRALAFGWDLRPLEEQGKVRTIFTSAEALSGDILTDSLLVGMLAEVGARRVVIDPITHYRLIYRDERQLRQQTYATINALKRLGQTSLLIAEIGIAGWTDPAPEEYLVDTVIKLGDSPIEGGSFRRLEVTKSSTFDQYLNSTLFRFAPCGIHTINAFTPSVPPMSGVLPAGIAALYSELGGCDSTGNFYLIQLETDVRRALMDLALVLLAGSGAGPVIHVGSSCVSPAQLWDVANSRGSGEALIALASRGRLQMGEPFGRQRPLPLPSSQFSSLKGYNADELISILGGSDVKTEPSSARQEKATALCDISDMSYLAGEAEFRFLLPRLVDALKSQGSSLFGILDARLMTSYSQAWIHGIADGVLRIWEANGARFAQVTKSVKNVRPDPRLFFETDEPPFFEVAR